MPGQTDRMIHDQIFLGDRWLRHDRHKHSRRPSHFGKVSVMFTFHLVVQHLQLISTRRWDEFFVHECKDDITDLLEFLFFFRDVLPRV